MTLVKLEYDRAELSHKIKEFDSLLAEKDEFGEKELDRFLRDRPVLMAAYLTNSYNLTPPDQYSDKEFCIAGAFRTDFLYLWQKTKRVVAIELEPAERGSIFDQESDTKTLPWASRFNTGFNQIIDWMHWFDSTSPDERLRHFKTETYDFDGVLIIGRNKFLEKDEYTKKRYEWRKSSLSVDCNGKTKSIKIITYDDFLNELKEIELTYDSLHNFINKKSDGA